ncbi:hypothetical protein ACAG26_16740 [Mycobacterium sp. pUA109]|uniref:hypothetical protein n=1 Tax=Mycobacterium sp. pUA109 TaxID=3238982 RepID=UPI00351ABF73
MASRAQEHQIFVDELRRLAAATADARVTAIAERAAAPVRVAVCGRAGVGRGTVAHALTCAGVAVTVPAQADVVVYVIAEVVKPEDSAAIAASRPPLLVVLNKADLAGSLRCAQVSALTGVRAEPLVAVLAATVLDGRLDATLWDALRVLAADATRPWCLDDFLNGPHRLPREVRLRLCDTLDLFGITAAVAALRRGRPTAAVQARLRALSGVDAVLARLAALGAEVHYRRMLDLVAELEALAVGADDACIGDFLSGDAAVFARASAAADVLEAAGLSIDRAADPAAQLRCAQSWQRYRRGPVSPMYRTCARDIARASLRRWSAAGGAA